MHSISPPIFDPQVNGYAGIDFQRDGISESDLLVATRAWRRDGGGCFLLTLITDEWPRLLARLDHLRRIITASPELGEVILGWHVEGPFLSEKPGFHGAHNPAWMRDPETVDFERLRDAAGPLPLMVTMAPERRGAVAAIDAARSLGIMVSLGHTDAPTTALREAVDAGATAFTHLGNGCPQQLDRHDNILWRVLDLDAPGVAIGLITDGIHVAPQLFRLIHRILPPERIYYTTDAMSAAGAPPGRYTIGTLEVDVGLDGVVRQPGRANFAGSSQRPGQIAGRAAQMLGMEPSARGIPRILANARGLLESRRISCAPSGASID